MLSEVARCGSVTHVTTCQLKLAGLLDIAGQPALISCSEKCCA